MREDIIKILDEFGCDIEYICVALIESRDQVSRLEEQTAEQNVRIAEQDRQIEDMESSIFSLEGEVDDLKYKLEKAESV